MFQQEDLTLNVNDRDEGADIYKILENAAEFEVMMAGMTLEQLSSFSIYQARQKEIKQSDMQQKIEKAWKDYGLISRDVTPFMRLRVVGLTGKGARKRVFSKEGLITIWNPTKNQVDLLEGKIYVVSGLISQSSASDILYLHG